MRSGAPLSSPTRLLSSLLCPHPPLLLKGSDAGKLGPGARFSAPARVSVSLPITLFLVDLVV